MIQPNGMFTKAMSTQSQNFQIKALRMNRGPMTSIYLNQVYKSKRVGEEREIEQYGGSCRFP
jgi:hypothetical protein